MNIIIDCGGLLFLQKKFIFHLHLLHYGNIFIYYVEKF